MNEKIQEYQRSYIELIATKVADKIDRRLSSTISETDKRLQRVEQRLYNGINFKVNLLMTFYGITVAGLIAILFKFIIKI